jgi:hypothetical protein
MRPAADHAFVSNAAFSPETRQATDKLRRSTLDRCLDGPTLPFSGLSAPQPPGVLVGSGQRVEANSAADASRRPFFFVGLVVSKPQRT